MTIWQRVRFDVFIRRDRVVMYVEGQQRLCQNLDPTSMTMAEGALGFWHILYHTSAEFDEIRAGSQTDDPQTGQHHVMHNTPFADMRTYDNVGVSGKCNSARGLRRQALPLGLERVAVRHPESVER